MNLRTLLAASLLCLGTTCLADDTTERIIDFESRYPRDFGYVIGDTFHHEHIVEVRKPYALKMQSLLPEGRVNLWLEHSNINVEKRRHPDSTIYQIQSKYQIVNTPEQKTQIFTPNLELEFVSQDDAFTLPFKSWGFTVLPLLQRDKGKLPQVSELQADMKPPLENIWPDVTRLILESIMLLTVLLYLFYKRYGAVWSRQRNSAFAEAYRNIRALHGQSMLDNQRQAMQCIHHALNTTAGKTVFAGDIDEFLLLHNEFRPVSHSIRRLFQASQAFFFVDDGDSHAPVYSYEECLQLSKDCKDIERRPK